MAPICTNSALPWGGWGNCAPVERRAGFLHGLLSVSGAGLAEPQGGT